MTANALYRHTHNYAGSDKHNGSANTVKVEKNDIDRRYLVVNHGGEGNLEFNSNIHVERNDLTSPVIHATNMLHIPGGRVWIDTSAVAVDGSGFNPQTLTDIAVLKDEIKKIKELLTDGSGQHSSLMAKDSQCVKGDILYYSKGGYRKADNRQAETAVNIAMAMSDSDKDGKVITSQCDVFDLKELTHDGDSVFLGENGMILFSAPKKIGTVVKLLGYVERNTFVFNSFGSAFINK